MVIDMIDCDFEVRLISKEILKRHDYYDYKFVYKVSLDLFNYGIRYYMFLDDSVEIGIWEIVDYVLMNFNVVDIKNFLSRAVNDNVYFSDMDNASFSNVDNAIVININDRNVNKRLKRNYRLVNKNDKFEN